MNTSTLPQTTPPLRTVRKAQGLSLRNVAERADIDVGQLSRVERGQSGLSIDALVRVADVLGLRQLAELLQPYCTAAADGDPPESAKPAVAGSKASRDRSDDGRYQPLLP